MTFVRSFLLLCTFSLSASYALASVENHTLSSGVAVKVLYFEPRPGVGSGELVMLVSGGTSNTFMARAQFWLGKELVDRGWAIAVPISPDSTGFGGANAQLLPELVGLIQVRHGLTTNKPLLVGISSGGSMALSIAAQFPETFRGVVATPGRLLEESEIKPLRGLPIYLRVGEKDDFRWNRQLDSMVSRLTIAGAHVNAAIVPDAKHIFQPDWDNLESWINGLQQPAQ